MTTKRTGYPVIDEILETIAPPPTSEQFDETYQCDACDRTITEDERRGGIPRWRGGNVLS